MANYNLQSDLELTLSILGKLTGTINQEIDGFEQQLLADLKNLEANPSVYESWKNSNDSSLVELYSLHLLDMLKDVKLITKIKANELKAQPEELTELVKNTTAKQKIQLVKTHENFRIIQHDCVERTCIPLTNNSDGYTLVETHDLESGNGRIEIVSKADKVYQHLQDSSLKSNPHDVASRYSHNPNMTIFTEIRGGDLLELRDRSISRHSRSRSKP